MSNPYDSPETQVAFMLANAIQRRQNYDQDQVIVTARPDINPGWKCDPQIEIVPGAVRPYGGGDGSQDGGALLREQDFAVWIFFKSNLDPYTTATMILLEKERGILEISEQVRKILVQINALPQTTNPLPSAGNFTLIEPIKWRGNGEVEWEDMEQRILRRPVTFRVAYGTDLPDGTDMVLANYQ